MSGLQRKLYVAFSVAVATLTVFVVLLVSFRALIPISKRTPNAVAELGAFPVHTWHYVVAAGVAAVVAVTLLRRPALELNRVVGAVVAVIAGGLFFGFSTVFGVYGLMVALAVLGGAAVATLLPGRLTDLRPRLSDRTVALVLWGGIALAGTIFSLHRYYSFGAGSWDHGCMTHNFYRASRFLDTRSTVLGNVDFLGDHFMIGIYLYAPLFWVAAGGATVLIIQAVNVAACGPAIFLIARDKGAGRSFALVLGLAVGLSFGAQSAMYFDSHEITVGIGFLAFGLWALERERLGLATVLIGTFALFKESLGAYVIGLGLLLLYRALTHADARRYLKYGVGWILGGAVWFVIVNRVFMPYLIARGNPPEYHETFADFGPTVFTAAVGMASAPLKALTAVFVPATKVHSQLVTLGSLGFLPVVSPQILIPALPLIAERFLSSKGTMWEMGYHYAVPLCLYAGWAVALSAPRIERGASRVLSWFGGPAGRGGLWAAVYVFTMWLVVNELGYNHPANFHRWEMEYFTKDPLRSAHESAVERLEGLGRDARLAVQNRILPHLADRAEIHRIGDWKKADYVLLSIGENAWPYDVGFPGRLARQLDRNKAWRLVFSELGTAIFARHEVSEFEPVEPSAELSTLLSRRPGGR